MREKNLKFIKRAFVIAADRKERCKSNKVNQQNVISASFWLHSASVKAATISFASFKNTF